MKRNTVERCINKLHWARPTWAQRSRARRWQYEPPSLRTGDLLSARRSVAAASSPPPRSKPGPSSPFQGLQLSGSAVPLDRRGPAFRGPR